MTAKKSVIKKQEIKKQEIKKPVNYKPVFLPIVIKHTIKTDANYYGIKQKLKTVYGIDLFRKLRNDKPKKEIKEKIKKESLWFKYCQWWNKRFNHE
jgi:hypothetical protein